MDTTIQDYIKILTSDPILKGKIYLPEGVTVSFRNLPGLIWEGSGAFGLPDCDSAKLRWYIESECGRLDRKALKDAILIVLSNEINLQNPS